MTTLLVPIDDDLRVDLQVALDSVASTLEKRGYTSRAQQWRARQAQFIAACALAAANAAPPGDPHAPRSL